MKRMIGLAIAASAAIVSIAPAQASGGCGAGFHRGPYGGCRPNRGPVFAGPLVIGGFYHGRGYWDGRRYWQNRYRWHGGWRYR